ncbi:uncharacterized protein [Mytilus edulis]|uniref:uncharacterized protein n=1 Tax=Mytilus edulis TaxID=6550 RepID=UPI0039EE34FA
MNLEDKNLSLQFYNYLCNIVGSREVVRTRREIFTGMDIVQNGHSGTGISSGSKAEGLDLKGSDYDQMGVFNSFRVYENLHDDQYNTHEIPLIMVTSDTKPGFTKLKLVNKSYLDTDIMHDLCEAVGEESYISSKRVREHGMRDDMIIHGPCQSTAGGELDFVSCLRCQEWITTAQQWIHRSRTTWPHHTLVNAAVQYGVLFVPIGCKNSTNENLQWRISFSVTEKLLIHSFSHTQLLCYALMKIILKDLIKPRHGDLLCSYFLKTIMFWFSEEISQSEWKPEKMISCFLDCFKRLIYCVEYKTCLHYFIPKYNLFEDKFNEEDHKKLMKTLKGIYGSPWTSIFYTETFLSYRFQSVNSNSMALSASALSCFSYIKVWYYPLSIYSVFKRFGNGLHHILKNEMCAYPISVCARTSVLNSDIFNLTDRNKSFYKQYKRLFVYFKISSQSDSVSSWLLVASLFYVCKRFRECLDIINYCLFSCTPDKIYVHTANSLVEQTVFEQMKQRLGLLLAFKHLVIEDVCFQHPFYLLPNELISLVTCEHPRLIFPPVVYAYLLQFLCYYHLDDCRGKHNALHNLELTIREQFLIFPSKSMLNRVNESLNLVKSLI